MSNIPPVPTHSFRVILQIDQGHSRLDSHLMEALRAQNENPQLKAISRTAFKELFKNKKILIKGQPARPSSELAAGTTYVDILL